MHLIKENKTQGKQMHTGIGVSVVLSPGPLASISWSYDLENLHPALFAWIPEKRIFPSLFPPKCWLWQPYPPDLDFRELELFQSSSSIFFWLFLCLKTGSSNFSSLVGDIDFFKPPIIHLKESWMKSYCKSLIQPLSIKFLRDPPLQSTRMV